MTEQELYAALVQAIADGEMTAWQAQVILRKFREKHGRMRNECIL